jgi:hypothetical protein
VARDLQVTRYRLPDALERVPVSLRQPLRTKRTSTKTAESHALRPPAPTPAWARASGRAGEGDPLFFARTPLALLDAASAKIRRVNADEAALRDLCFAVGDPLGPAANRYRYGAISPAGHPASTQA